MISMDDLVLECEIIGSFIIDASIHDYLYKLKEDDFIDTTNRAVYKTMLQLKWIRKVEIHNRLEVN